MRVQICKEINVAQLNMTIDEYEIKYPNNDRPYLIMSVETCKSLAHEFGISWCKVGVDKCPMYLGYRIVFDDCLDYGVVDIR